MAILSRVWAWLVLVFGGAGYTYSICIRHPRQGFGKGKSLAQLSPSRKLSYDNSHQKGKSNHVCRKDVDMTRTEKAECGLILIFDKRLTINRREKSCRSLLLFQTRSYLPKYRGTQREYSSKPLQHSIVKHLLVFKW